MAGGAAWAETPTGAPGAVYPAGSLASPAADVPSTSASPENTGLRRLAPGESLSSGADTAALVMGRGALLRLGPGTTVRMVAQDAGRTEISLQSGRADATVNVVPKGRLLLIDMPDGQIQMAANGLYSFNAATDEVRVFDGEALAFPGTDPTADVKPLKIKHDHELALSAGHLHADHFDRELAEADLLPWTNREADTTQAYTDGSYGGGGGAGYGSAFSGDDGGYGGGYPYGGFGFGAPFGGYGGFGLPFGYGGGFGLGLGFGYAGLGWGDPFGFGPFGYGYPFFGGLGFYGGIPYYGGGYGTGVGHLPTRQPGGHPIGTAGARGFSPSGTRSFGGGRPAASFGGFHGGGFGGGGFHGGGGGHR